MLQRLWDEKIEVTAVYHCPHAPEESCACRKPAPGMFLQAIREHDIDPDQSWMVGDKPGDMEAAATAGVKHRVMIGATQSPHSTTIISRIGMLGHLFK